MEAKRPALPGHRLQELLLVADPDRRALYWRQADSAGVPLDGMTPGAIPAGGHLLLDTLLNSFFERYWRDLTGVETLKLAVRTSGPCRIRMVRRIAGRPETTLAETMADGAEARSVLSVSLADLSDSDAIIHAEVEAFVREAYLHDGAWLTDTPARNVVRLAIVICSFGRESMLVENLRRMAPIVARTDEIVALHVVRQGGAELEAFVPYRALAAETSFGGKFRLIRQDNFGGTGGFVRGVLESLDMEATHILLLDDDVRIEPAILERLAVLARHLTSPTTVGGQMLDLLRPNLLHASHEWVDLRRLRLHNPCRDTAMDAPRAIDMFGHRHTSDYNAWWLCCIPATTFRDVGFPLPMFIRHDDVEHGVRTIARGARLVTMPGIFVWHAPFTAKNVTPSFVYYERRNFMIAAAIHGKADPFALVLRHWQDAWVGLRRHRYEYCWAVCRAVDDFLDGPHVVFSSIRERHRGLMADQARFTLLTMTKLRHRAGSGRAASLARLLLWPSGRDRAQAAYAVTVRHLAFAILRTGLALLWRSGRVAPRYRAEAATYTSQAFWREQLALPPQGNPEP